MDSISELGDQLVVEVFVRDLDRSLAIYTALGFTFEHVTCSRIRGDRRSVIRLRPNMPWRSNEQLARVTQDR